VPDASAHGLVFGDFSWEASDANDEFVSGGIVATSG
jgi:hypothetical protein